VTRSNLVREHALGFTQSTWFKTLLRVADPRSVPAAILACICTTALNAQPTSALTNATALWANPPWSDPKFFPIAVWLQIPKNAARYQKAGINTYIGLWMGPTEDQLSALKQAGMYVICEQNEVSLRHLSDRTILGWMTRDEPDNAQSRGARLGWSSPIPPEKVVEEYNTMKTGDPSRPVFLNLGQGVAWDDWYGRGSRTHHPEDYPNYAAGADIVSFDIYPATHSSKAVSGNLGYVARGVERLVQWTEGKKRVWNCIEAARIENEDRKPTPQEIRCEVWMSLIHGSRGLIYFVHQFKPRFIEASLLEDAELLAAVTSLNQQVTELAPVLNSPTVRDAATVKTKSIDVPVAIVVKRLDGVTYVFAVAMRKDDTPARFTIKGLKDEQSIEVLGEKRSLKPMDGSFTDHFGPWEVHLYRFR
jgi:hypothetical protein